MPVSFFFESMPAEAAGVRGLSEPPAQPFEQVQLTRRETLELVRAYYRIEDPKVRNRVFDLVKAIAAGGAARSP